MADADAREDELESAEGEREHDEVEEEAQRMGKLAIPFGPFIALSALEYVFLGEFLVPLITGGVMTPNGFIP